VSEKRLKKLRKVIKEKKCSAAAVCSEADIYYLTSVKTSGLLVVKENEACLFIPAVNYNETIDEISKNISCRMFQGNLPWTEIRDIIPSGRLLVDSSIAYSFFSKLKEAAELKMEDNPVGLIRMIKDEEEIKRIRKSCKVAAGIVNKIEAEEWVGKTEKELAAFLVSESWLQGEGVSFTPVIASGPNSACPHHFAGNSVISRTWLKVDYGIKLKGYCSDLTRTFILNKFVDNYDSHDLYSKLSEVKAKAVELLRPGVKCSDIYSKAVKELKISGLEKYFIHGLGHGVGIEVHEPPYLKAHESILLEEGMVVTVEPGIYFQGVGGMRIEDTYLITEKGSEQLTR